MQLQRKKNAYRFRSWNARRSWRRAGSISMHRTKTRDNLIKEALKQIQHHLVNRYDWISPANKNFIQDSITTSWLGRFWLTKRVNNVTVLDASTRSWFSVLPQQIDGCSYADPVKMYRVYSIVATYNTLNSRGRWSNPKASFSAKASN